MFTRIVAGNNRTRVLFMMGEVEAAEQEWFLTLGCRRGCTTKRARHMPWRASARSRHRVGEGWRAGALVAVDAAMRQRTGIFDVDGFAVHPAPLAAAARERPRERRGGRACGSRDERRRGDRIGAARCRRGRAVREALAQW